MESPIVHTLCYRCEHRAIWHETKQGPRAECHGSETGVRSCYMYSPVLPCITEKNKSDKRPRFAGAMLSSRENLVRVVDISEMVMKCVVNGKEALLYWIPKRIVVSKTKKRKS